MIYLTVVFIIGFLILIHEIGHLVAAKWTGIPIARFSIGFGPVLMRFKGNLTEYCISLIPLGGYVFPDVKDESEFFKIPIYKRIIFSSGGPLANIILGIFLIAIMNILMNGFTITGAFIKPLVQAGSFVYKIVSSIPKAFSHSEELSGLIGIVFQGKQFIGADVLRALNFTIILSLNLAVFNLLPFPILDGGKIFLYLLEKMHRRLVNLHVPLSIAGWVLMLGLLVYATYLDISKYVLKLFV